MPVKWLDLSLSADDRAIKPELKDVESQRRKLKVTYTCIRLIKLHSNTVWYASA